MRALRAATGGQSRLSRCKDPRCGCGIRSLGSWPLFCAAWRMPKPKIRPHLTPRAWPLRRQKVLSPSASLLRSRADSSSRKVRSRISEESMQAAHSRVGHIVGEDQQERRHRESSPVFGRSLAGSSGDGRCLAKQAYFVKGEPVEVDTEIGATFTLAY